MSDSSINITPGVGGPNCDLQTLDNGNVRQAIVIGDPTSVSKTAPVDSVFGLSVNPTTLPPGAAKETGGNLDNIKADLDTIKSQTSQLATTQPVNVQNPVQVAAANLCISATGATGVGVTATLPAVVGQSHYITLIEIHKYFTVANAASATPLVITTTNLPGPLAFTFGQPLGAIGVTDERIYASNSPLKSSIANTPTTIVCPATTGIIWRINVYYFAAP